MATSLWSTFPCGSAAQTAYHNGASDWCLRCGHYCSFTACHLLQKHSWCPPYRSVCGNTATHAPQMHVVHSITHTHTSIQYMATTLRLPSDIAGITLFAFATGAPDIFTQLAAINEGQHVDIQLAVSSTLGSGLFIICIVLAVVLLLTPTSIVVQVCGWCNCGAHVCVCVHILLQYDQTVCVSARMTSMTTTNTHCIHPQHPPSPCPLTGHHQLCT